MLLINGEILENKDTDSAIEFALTMIPETLSNNQLTIDHVLAAADQLVKEFASGNLKDELAAYIDLEQVLDHEIDKVIYKFQSEQLKERLKYELNCTSEDIIIAPKGVLLHIAAGNLDILPAYSVLEGLLTKNINLLKLPSIDHGLSIFLLNKLIQYQPILKEYIYVFDTPSSDILTIQKLMGLANAIVIWGSDEAISAIRKSAPINVELIEWGHKLSFCYLADLSISDSLLIKLARHILETNQLLCNSIQGIFLNTPDFNQVLDFSKRFNQILVSLEKDYPLPVYLQGKITIELLTKKMENRIHPVKLAINNRSSIVCKEDSILELSDLYGSIWVKPLTQSNIVKELFLHKSHLQTVYLYPAENKELIDLFSQSGCTTICDLNRMENTFLSKTHDGKFSLQQYVRFVEVSNK